MPSIWEFALRPRSPVRVHRTHLHGLLSNGLDHALTTGEHKSSERPKPWALGPFALEDGIWRVRLHLLLDELAYPFGAWLAGMSGDLHLGRVPASLVPGPGGSVLRCVRHQPWDALADAPALRRWRLHLLTPTLVGSNGRPSPTPTPEAVIRHLRIRWPYAPRHLHPVREITVRDLGLAQDAADLRTVTETYRNTTVRGSVGWIDQSARHASDEQARRLGQWLALVPYAGIGSQTTHGFGVAEIRP